MSNGTINKGSLLKGFGSGGSGGGGNIVAKFYTIDASTDTFSATDFKKISQVFVNAELLTEGTDYTVSSTTITFTNSLSASDVLTIVGKEA